MPTNTKKQLILFYRNPEEGKVKTRLAATVGNQKALEIYLKLVQHTQHITHQLAVEKVVWYSHHIDTNDSWSTHQFAKKLQQGNDLGSKMKHAFSEAFANGYKHVCIIGTDCLDLTQSIIEQAFAALEKTDTVLGPAMDGGYYLLGMKSMHPTLFENKAWSTHTVAHDTLKDFLTHNLSTTLLPIISDIDVEEDLKGRLLK